MYLPHIFGCIFSQYPGVWNLVPLCLMWLLWQREKPLNLWGLREIVNSSQRTILRPVVWLFQDLGLHGSIFSSWFHCFSQYCLMCCSFVYPLLVTFSSRWCIFYALGSFFQIFNEVSYYLSKKKYFLNILLQGPAGQWVDVMKKKRAIHEEVINSVHQKRSINPVNEVNLSK